MLVVNMLGGPGAGKTHAAWNLAAELKRKGLVVEYVPEYAKELVWENDFDTLAKQEDIFQEQFRRINRLNGKVDVVVTDSPLILSEIYGEWNSKEFTADIYAAVNRFETFNIVVQRDESHYEQAGRLQNLEQSKSIDKKVLKLLDDNRIYYGTYTHERLSYLSGNIEKTLSRINSKPQSPEQKLLTELEMTLVNKRNNNYTLTEFISSACKTYTGTDIKKAMEIWHPISTAEKEFKQKYIENIFSNRNGTDYLILGKKNADALLFSLSKSPEPFIYAHGLGKTDWQHGNYFKDFENAADFFYKETVFEKDCSIELGG